MSKCKHCLMTTHSSFQCFSAPRKPLKAKKPMKKIGAVSKRLLAQREQYFEDNPSEDGYYHCYYCLIQGIEEPLLREDVQIEHFYTKTHRPDLRFDRANLVLSCARHNEDKGTMDGPDYLEKLEQLRREND